MHLEDMKRHRYLQPSPPMELLPWYPGRRGRGYMEGSREFPSRTGYPVSTSLGYQPLKRSQSLQQLDGGGKPNGVVRNAWVSGETDIFS